MKHSNIVGGSSAKRVMACPGSVPLCAAMPPQPENDYTRRGTLLHEAISFILEEKVKEPADVIGMSYGSATLDQTLYDEKILPALKALDDIDPDNTLIYASEQQVSFGDFMPGAFGTTDLIGRMGDTVVLLDWKFGDGVPVEAEENDQGMYYVAAARRTESLRWVFDGAEDVEIIIVQPPSVKRWRTTFDRIDKFELDLALALDLASRPDAPLNLGDHCRWCSAKPVCPLKTGEADRALKMSLDGLSPDSIAGALTTADMLDDWIASVRELSMQLLEKGVKLPGWKLVQKRATRKWIDELTTRKQLMQCGLKESDMVETVMLSPAKVEKLLKPLKISLPDGLVVSASSGNTFAPESDPRPEVQLLGVQLSDALSKLS